MKTVLATKRHISHIKEEPDFLISFFVCLMRLFVAKKL